MRVHHNREPMSAHEPKYPDVLSPTAKVLHEEEMRKPATSKKVSEEDKRAISDIIVKLLMRARHEF